jgi:hypothetical protein
MFNANDPALREAALLQREYDAACRECEETKERCKRAKAHLHEAGRKALSAYQCWKAIQRAQHVKLRLQLLIIVRSQ